jgi:hypothetical protein
MTTDGQNIDVKIGSEEMVFWKLVIENTERELKNAKNSIRISEMILVGAKERYAAEEEAWNKK